ncbi:MAG: hypothetical protein IT342_00655, partial [Candidatus Melainabacteria bacterium]|nr:hypothetical protein [Candidatus Melainabacteria bacterium]
MAHTNKESVVEQTEELSIQEQPLQDFDLHGSSDEPTSACDLTLRDFSEEQNWSSDLALLSSAGGLDEWKSFAATRELSLNATTEKLPKLTLLNFSPEGDKGIERSATQPIARANEPELDGGSVTPGMPARITEPLPESPPGISINLPRKDSPGFTLNDPKDSLNLVDPVAGKERSPDPTTEPNIPDTVPDQPPRITNPFRPNPPAIIRIINNPGERSSHGTGAGGVMGPRYAGPGKTDANQATNNVAAALAKHLEEMKLATARLAHDEKNASKLAGKEAAVAAENFRKLLTRAAQNGARLSGRKEGTLQSKLIENALLKRPDGIQSKKEEPLLTKRDEVDAPKEEDGALPKKSETILAMETEFAPLKKLQGVIPRSGKTLVTMATEDAPMKKVQGTLFGSGESALPASGENLLRAGGDCTLPAACERILPTAGQFARTIGAKIILPATGESELSKRKEVSLHLRDRREAPLSSSNPLLHAKVAEAETAALDAASSLSSVETQMKLRQFAAAGEPQGSEIVAQVEKARAEAAQVIAQAQIERTPYAVAANLPLNTSRMHRAKLVEPTAETKPHQKLASAEVASAIEPNGIHQTQRQEAIGKLKINADLKSFVVAQDDVSAKPKQFAAVAAASESTRVSNALRPDLVTGANMQYNRLVAWSGFRSDREVQGPALSNRAIKCLVVSLPQVAALETVAQGGHLTHLPQLQIYKQFSFARTLGTTTELTATPGSIAGTGAVRPKSTTFVAIPGTQIRGSFVHAKDSITSSAAKQTSAITSKEQSNTLAAVKKANVIAAVTRSNETTVYKDSPSPITAKPTVTLAQAETSMLAATVTPVVAKSTRETSIIRTSDKPTIARAAVELTIVAGPELVSDEPNIGKEKTADSKFNGLADKHTTEGETEPVTGESAEVDKFSKLAVDYKLSVTYLHIGNKLLILQRRLEPKHTAEDAPSAPCQLAASGGTAALLISMKRRRQRKKIGSQSRDSSIDELPSEEEPAKPSIADYLLNPNSAPIAAPLSRFSYMIQPGDSLSGIAMSIWQDADIAWLIAEINKLTPEWQGQECKVTVSERQVIALPVADEVVEFYRSGRYSQHKNYRLTTIVESGAIETELL